MEEQITKIIISNYNGPDITPRCKFIFDQQTIPLASIVREEVLRKNDWNMTKNGPVR